MNVMTTNLVVFDLDKLLEAETLTRDVVSSIREHVYKSRASMENLEKKIASLKTAIKNERNAAKVKDLTLLLGICEWIVGRVKEAAELLKDVKARKIGAYYLGKCYQDLGEYRLALEYFERARKTDEEEFDISMDIAETKRMMGDVEEALKIIEDFSQSHAENAELHYQWGFCLDEMGRHQEALEHYEHAVQINPDHAKSLFRIAFNYDMDGDDERAISFYERCTNLQPAYRNAFMNLGTLYEDIGNYDDAAYCFETVLDVEPTHERAAMFLKDVKSSMKMYYDEDIAKKQGKENEVLNIPISDFELSVRSRNCLEKMNIKTLRDLTRITEADLLSYKNFGETSLNEIKSIMAQKGLRLGQAIEGDIDAELFSKKEKKKRYVNTISDIGLSTRCRNALDRAGIVSIQDLINKTELELEQEGLKEAYIGEIKEKLLKHSLSLKEEGEAEPAMMHPEEEE